MNDSSIIAQQILLNLKVLYPIFVDTDRIVNHPIMSALQVEKNAIIDTLNDLKLAEYLEDSYTQYPAGGHRYRITHAGVLQITRRTRLDTLIWGASAL